MVRVQRLSEVWRAEEWVDSSDSGEDAIKAALEGYRAAPYSRGPVAAE